MTKPATLGLILALVIVAYASTWRAGFVYEDARSVISNGEVQQVQPWKLHELRSLSVLSFRLNHALDGNNPRGYHAVNVVVHLVNISLFYLIASAVLDTDVAALFAVAIFALSPLQSESVAYITGRTELLSGLSVLAAMALATSRPRPWHVAAIPGLLLAGLLCKETAMVGWLLVPMIYLFQYGQIWKRLSVTALSILLPVGALMAVLALWLLHPLQHIDTGFIGSERGYLSYVAIQCAATWRYLFSVIVPYGFTIDHDYDLIPHTLAYASIVGVLAIGAWGWAQRQTEPAEALGVCWMLLALLPRFFVRIPEYLNEHQMYVAMMGVSLVLGNWCARLSLAWDARAGWFRVTHYAE